MKKKLLTLTCLVFVTVALTAQSKKDMREEISSLKSQLSQTEGELQQARQNEKISQEQAAAYAEQVSELQDANATVLNNLKVLTEATQQRSDNISNALQSLRDKEQQIAAVTDQFVAHDSIALLMLTDFKRSLGENTRMGIEKGFLTIQLDKNFLFGSSDAGHSLTPQATTFLGNIATVLKSSPDSDLTVIHASGDNAAAGARVGAILNFMQTDSEIKASRLNTHQSGSSFETYNIMIHPALTKFYLSSRQTFKG